MAKSLVLDELWENKPKKQNQEIKGEMGGKMKGWYKHVKRRNDVLHGGGKWGMESPIILCQNLVELVGSFGR